jgi:hypothetical protein
MTAEASLVVVCHDMTPQLRRTLVSLGPGYQRDCPRGRLEVIVVDNGSAIPVTEADVRVDGLAVALHHVRNAPLSPVAAANLGLALAGAPVIAMWIDGARLASAGLVDACLRACRLHPIPVVAPCNHHLGHVPQYRSVTQGYDTAVEDALLRSIDWPGRPERLFEIAVPELGIDCMGPMLESNALLMPRAQWDALGGYDERFASPGGGAANHDLFVRACEMPGAQLIRIAGEGKFHQIHGGLASNTADRTVQARIAIEYMQLRRRKLRAVRTPGWLFDPARGEAMPL